MGWDYQKARDGETAFDVLKNDLPDVEWELSDETIDGQGIAYGAANDGGGFTFAIVALLDDTGEANCIQGGYVGYKLMDEMQGPAYTGASDGLLAKLSDVSELPYGGKIADAWRGMCREQAVS